jgi:hypothetical protein
MADSPRKSYCHSVAVRAIQELGIASFLPRWVFSVKAVMIAVQAVKLLCYAVLAGYVSETVKECLLFFVRLLVLDKISVDLVSGILLSVK